MQQARQRKQKEKQTDIADGHADTRVCRCVYISRQKCRNKQTKREKGKKKAKTEEKIDKNIYTPKEKATRRKGKKNIKMGKR